MSSQQRNEKLWGEVVYLLDWYQSRPRAEIAGIYQGIQISCGDLYLLRQGFVTVDVLLLWSRTKCRHQYTEVLNPDILTQFRSNGPEQVRQWARSTEIGRALQVLIPVQAGRLWDLILIDPVEKLAHYHQLSGSECEPQQQPLLETAMTLVANANIDEWWLDNLVSFDTRVHTYSSSLPPTAICHYLQQLSQHESVPAQEDLEGMAEELVFELADNTLGLINSKLDSYCVCLNANADDSEVMIACDNPYCSGKWFHLGKCTGLDSVPKGAWYCEACSSMR